MIRTLLLSIFLTPVLTLGGQTLRSIVEVLSAPDEMVAAKMPVEITGCVEARSRNDPGDYQIIIFSSDGKIMVIADDTPIPPKPGDVIKLRGETYLTSHSRHGIMAKSYVRLGQKDPQTPVSIPLEELCRGHRVPNHTAVITEGIIEDAVLDEVDTRWAYIALRAVVDRLYVIMPASAGLLERLSRLNGARVRISGYYSTASAGARAFLGGRISIDSEKDITLMDPPPTDPMQAPPFPIPGGLTPHELSTMDRRSIVGRVRASWRGDRFIVRTDNNGNDILVFVPVGMPLPIPDETVTASGFPGTDLFHVNLTCGIWEKAEPSPNRSSSLLEPTAETPSDLFITSNGREALNPSYDLKPIRLVGTVEDGPDFDERFFLVCGRHRVCVERGTAMSRHSARLRPGMTVDAVGICLLETDNWRPRAPLPHVRGISLIPRSDGDIRILRAPPWWTPAKFMSVIGSLALLLAAMALWIYALNRVAAKRGRTLAKEQIAHAVSELKVEERTRLAVELHDSLSQNLAGVACQVAASRRALQQTQVPVPAGLSSAERMLKSCRTELRNCLFDLRSDTLVEKDFTVAIRRTLERLASGIRLVIRFNVPRSRLSERTAHAILCIIRELTSNAVVHGHATQVRIAGAIETDALRFSVTDNGGGFDPSAAPGSDQGHFGLEGIRERIRSLGGTVSIESAPGAGTRTVVSVPTPHPQTGVPS